MSEKMVNDKITGNDLEEKFKSEKTYSSAAYPNPGEPTNSSCPNCTNGFFYSLFPWPGRWVPCGMCNGRN